LERLAPIRGKHWLILYGVLPKRARDLAETVLYDRASLAALISLHGAGVGVAGFPRHARSAGSSSAQPRAPPRSLRAPEAATP